VCAHHKKAFVVVVAVVVVVVVVVAAAATIIIIIIRTTCEWNSKNSTAPDCMVHAKKKVKLSLVLIKHHAMKMYGGVHNKKLHFFLTLTLIIRLIRRYNELTHMTRAFSML
jgi:hypothetical protein